MIQITLTARQMMHIQRYVRINRTDVAVINFINQNAAAIPDKYDPEQLITNVVPEELIVYAYEVLGYQQSRLVASENQRIQQALFSQLDGHPELAARLLEITDRNIADDDQGIEAEVKFTQAINL